MANKTSFCVLNSSDPMSFQFAHGHQRFQKQMASVTMFRMAVVRNEETADTPTATNVEREKSLLWKGNSFEPHLHSGITFVMIMYQFQLSPNKRIDFKIFVSWINHLDVKKQSDMLQQMGVSQLFIINIKFLVFLNYPRCWTPGKNVKPARSPNLQWFAFRRTEFETKSF